MDQHMMVGLLYPEAEPPTLILEMAEEKKREKVTLEKEIGKIPEMTVHSGPTNVGLEEALQQLRVSRQAYHGRSFVGNHVHKCLQPENTDLITAAISKKVQSLCPNDRDLIQKAEEIANKDIKRVYVVLPSELPPESVTPNSIYCSIMSSLVQRLESKPWDDG
nr:uncharacterized protein LOC129261192 [Lytechinus pictus]